MAMSQQKAISATVTGDDQEVGFRAKVMKQAIEYNLAGVAKNEPNMIVRFTLQGDGKRVDKAIAAIKEGTKRSTGVKEPRPCRFADHPTGPLHFSTNRPGSPGIGDRDQSEPLIGINRNGRSEWVGTLTRTRLMASRCR
jgi:acylphosphatase